MTSSGDRPTGITGGQKEQKISEMCISVHRKCAIRLTDRSYYLRDNDRFKTIRRQYVNNVTKMLLLSREGPLQATADAQRILELETKLAASQLTRVEQRVPENTYHPTAVTELASMAPAVDWPAYLQNLGLSTTSLNASQPKYINTVSHVPNTVPIEDWKASLR